MTPKATKEMQKRIEKMLKKGKLTKGALTTFYQNAYKQGVKDTEAAIKEAEKLSYKAGKKAGKTVLLNKSIKVLVMDADGNTTEYSSIGKAARELGVNKSTLSKGTEHNKKYNTYHGYTVWRKESEDKK